MSEFWFQLRRFGGWAIGLIGFVASLIAGWDIIGIWLESQNSISMAANIYILAIVTIVVAILSFRHYQTMRKEKYANIAPLLHQIVHGLRDLDTYTLEKQPAKDSSEQEYSMYLQSVEVMFGRILDQLATVFEMLTSTHCRTSIKLTYLNDGSLHYYTYKRDQWSQGRCARKDIERMKENHDPLSKNAVFTRLFEDKEDKWHYFNNDLCGDHKFTTTSMTAYKPDHAERPGPHGWFHSLQSKWPLPYRSTLACVIRQGPFDFDPKRQSEVLGFLTVDSASRGVFVEKWDIQLVFAVADAMFHPLKRVVVVQGLADAASSKPKELAGN